MISHEDKIIYDVLKRFDGMHKIDICDVLHKIEVLLSGLSTPLDYAKIKKELPYSYPKQNVTAIDKNGYCYLEDHCHFMKVYRVTSVFPTFLIGHDLCFTTQEQDKLTPYTNKNIRLAFQDSPLQVIVDHFLKNNAAKKKNPKTKRLLLLELFDQIDPY